MFTRRRFLKALAVIGLAASTTWTFVSKPFIKLRRHPPGVMGGMPVATVSRYAVTLEDIVKEYCRIWGREPGFLRSGEDI